MTNSRESAEDHSITTDDRHAAAVSLAAGSVATECDEGKLTPECARVKFMAGNPPTASHDKPLCPQNKALEVNGWYSEPRVLFLPSGVCGLSSNVLSLFRGEVLRSGRATS
jgi:hypothetical protein